MGGIVSILSSVVVVDAGQLGGLASQLAIKYVDERTFGTSRESGRKRVPRDAPPTCRQRNCQ